MQPHLSRAQGMAILKTRFRGMLFALLAGMILFWMPTTTPAAQESSVALPHRPVIFPSTTACPPSIAAWLTNTNGCSRPLAHNLA
jgi:hypothetical protein